MKYLRITGSPDLEAVPDVFRLVAASPHASEARLLGWDVPPAGEADPGPITVLFVVDGDREAMAAALADSPTTAGVDVAPLAPGRFYLLLDLRPSAASLVRRVFETVVTEGLVVVTPVVYRDGEVHARLVGHSAAVGAAVERFPPVIDVTVREVGEGGIHPGSPARGLSDRQREAVLAALDLGYYDQPRRATHADVAGRLDCAPSTASEHLRKAEAKLVRAGLRG